MNTRPSEMLKSLEMPLSNVGAPLPHILADDHKLAIAYLVADADPAWDGSDVRIVTGEEDGLCAVIKASHYMAAQLGPPNDEAIAGHRYAPLGIEPHSTYEVLNSFWIADLEKGNRVHPYHRPDHFRSLRHFVFTFHDSTLEMIAEGLSVEVRRGRLRDLLLEAFTAAN